MAGGNRRVTRIINNSKNSNVIFAEDRSSDPVIMKHIRLPPLPRESNVGFEILKVFHVAVFASLQFLHLYRRVWWLPQSFNNFTMSFHLIDGNLIAFILAVLGRRIPYLLLKSILPTFSHWILQLILTVHMLFWLVFTSYSLIMVKYDDDGHRGHLNIVVHLIYLFGPSLLYAHVYGFTITPLFDSDELDMTCNNEHRHVCSWISNQIRDEVEYLRQLFNLRLRRVLVQATLISYYSSFLPWAFVQPFIHYNLWFVTQHLILTWLLSFSLLLSRAFNPEFSDSLHKVACHLGKWSKLRPNHVPSQTWHADLIILPGSIVKHQRELFKAEGYVPITSEPGNPVHCKFQFMFSGSTFSRILLGYHVALIMICLAILIRVTEWYQVISISCLVITSLFTFVRLARDYLVIKSMYEAEEVITLRTS